MDNIIEYDLELENKTTVKYIKLNLGDNEFMTMPKAIWDELEAQREQSETL